MNEEMEKMDGKDLEIVMSHRAAISMKAGIVLLQLTLEGHPKPLTIALPPDQAKAVSNSLLASLARIQSIQ